MADPFLNLHALSVNCQCTNKLGMEFLLPACMTCFFLCSVRKKARGSMCTVHSPPEAKEASNSGDKRLVSYEGLTFEQQNILKFILNTVKQRSVKSFLLNLLGRGLLYKTKMQLVTFKLA